MRSLATAPCRRRWRHRSCRRAPPRWRRGSSASIGDSAMTRRRAPCPAPAEPEQRLRAVSQRTLEGSAAYFDMAHLAGLATREPGTAVYAGRGAGRAPCCRCRRSLCKSPRTRAVPPHTPWSTRRGPSDPAPTQGSALPRRPPAAAAACAVCGFTGCLPAGPLARA